MKAMILLGLLALPGCASTAMRFGTATMEADPTEIGAEGIALQNELGLAYTKTRPAAFKDDDPQICRYTKPSFQERDKYTYSRHNVSGQSTLAEYKFSCLYLRETTDKDSTQVLRHLLAGFALSDLYCDTYFRRIARRWNERLFLRNTTNDVGAAISAVLGLATAGSAVTGGVGAAFGLADSAFRNYDNVFVVSPDLPAMQNLVRERQKKLRDELLAKPPTDYYSAQSEIIDYARFCSYTGMKGLLNLAVDNTINDLRGGDAIRSAVVTTATAQEAQKRAIAEKRATDSEAELAAIKREKAAQASIEKEKPAKADDADKASKSATPAPAPQH